MIAISATFDSIRGPQLHVRLPRVVECHSPLWQYAQRGDIGSMQKLFSSREASPFDVNPRGESALHVSDFVDKNW